MIGFTHRDDCIYDLKTVAQMNWRDGDRYLNDPDSGFTPVTAKAQFSKAYDRWRVEQRTDDEFMELSFLDVAAKQALWLAHAGDIAGQCQSRAFIGIPAGSFQHTIPLTSAYGAIHGHSPSNFWSNGGDKWTGTIAQGGTEIVLNHLRWKGKQTDHQVQPTTAGQEGFWSYQEDVSIRNLIVDGNKRSNVYDPARQIGGVMFYDGGSLSDGDRIFCKNNEGPGITFARGTPSWIGRIAVMFSNTCGVDLVGGGQFDILNFETDECPSAYRIRSGYGRAAGATGKLNATKIETGRVVNDPNRPIGKGSAFIDMIDPGCVNLECGTVWGSTVNQFNADFIRLNCPLDKNTSFLSMSNAYQFGGIRTLLFDVANKKAWLTDHGTNYSQSFQSKMRSFVWVNWGGGQLQTGTFEAIPDQVYRPKPNRMQASDVDPMTGNRTATYNDLDGTPVYTHVPQDTGGGVTPPGVPTIVSFAALPAVLTGSGQVKLSWDTLNTTSVTISGVGGTLASKGEVTVPVNQTKNFILTATNASGSVTSSVTVTVSSTVAQLSVTFQGKNVMALPGCKTIPVNEAWRSGSISGAVFSTNANTQQNLVAPIAVTKMILRGCTVRETNDYRFLNDEVRTLGGKFIRNNVQVGQFTVNVKSDIVLTFATPATIDTLIGALGNTYNTLLLTLEGIELYT